MILRKNSVRFHIGHPGGTPADHSGKNALPAFDFPEHGIGERDFAIPADRRKLDKPPRLADWKVTKEQCIDQREDGGIRADAQGERKHRDDREAGILAKDT